MAAGPLLFVRRVAGDNYFVRLDRLGAIQFVQAGEGVARVDAGRDLWLVS